jgi:hypothetical protein
MTRKIYAEIFWKTVCELCRETGFEGFGGLLESMEMMRGFCRIE